MLIIDGSTGKRVDRAVGLGRTQKALQFTATLELTLQIECEVPRQWRKDVASLPEGTEDASAGRCGAWRRTPRVPCGWKGEGWDTEEKGEN